MKTYIYTLLLTFTAINIAHAQVPDSINYQAVIRNANGTLIAMNKVVNFKFVVIVGGSNYTETQLHTITNKFGLANLKIGNGSVATGSVAKLSALPWAQGNATLTVDIDTIGGTTFANISTTSLVTVPYAFYSDKAGKSNVANDVANLGFNTSTNTLTVGAQTTTIPIPVIKRDTIVTAFDNTNNLGITSTPGGAPGGGTQYTIVAKTQDLAITNTTSNTLTLSKNGIGDNINFNQGNGVKISSTPNSINFSIDDAYIRDSIKSIIKDTLKSITRVRFNTTTNKTYVYTPLPKLKINPSTNILTIYDTLKPLNNTVDLSYLAERDTVVKVVAGSGVSVTPAVSNNIKTFTVENTSIDKTVVFTPLTGNVTQIGGAYPNFTIYTPKSSIDTLKLDNIGLNYMRVYIDSKQNDATIIASNKIKRTGNSISSKINYPNLFPIKTNDSTDIIDGIVHKITAGKLTTIINGINSNQLSVFDTITLKMPLLYSDITVNGGSNKILTPTLIKQKPNTFLSGPATGLTPLNDSIPKFRVLAEKDLPTSVVLKTSLTPNRLPKQGTGAYLVDSKLYEIASGNIAWNFPGVQLPANNLSLHGQSNPSTFQLTNTAGGITATSGFVAKFNGTNTLLSTQGEMLLTDNLSKERLRLTDTTVYVGKNLSGNYISLDLSDKLRIRGNAGNINEVLTSQGPNSIPQWKPAVGSNIWTKIGTTPNATITQTDVADNVNLGNSSNTNINARLAVYNLANHKNGIFATAAVSAGIFNSNNADTATVILRNTVTNGGPALQVDGGQIVKTRVVTTSTNTQTKGDYLLIVSDAVNSLTLLDPANVTEGTVIIVRKMGGFNLTIGLPTGSPGTSKINIYSLPAWFSTMGTPTSSSFTTNIDYSFRLVATKIGTDNVWIEW